MNTNNAVQQLLNENRKALQFLHLAKGFDFEAPHLIKRIPGSFTFNSVNKIIREHIKNDYVAALLIKPGLNGYGWRKALIYADLTEYGKFDASNQRGLPMYNHQIDYCFGVGDFEELRKKNTSHFYIIAQERSALKTYQAKPVNFSQRFHQAREPHFCGDGRGNRWISSIDIKPYIGTGKAFEYKLERHSEQTNNVYDILDKSGYLVCRTRRDLKQRALQRRYEKKRDAARNLDTSKRESTIRIRLDTLKTQLSNRVLMIENHEDAEKINKAANNLRWALFYFERYLSRRENNEYSSIEQIEGVFENIENYITGAWEK